MPNLEQLSAWAQSPFAATLLVAVVVMLTSWLCLRAYLGKGIEPEPDITFPIEALREYHEAVYEEMVIVAETRHGLEGLRRLEEWDKLDQLTATYTHPVIEHWLRTDRDCPLNGNYEKVLNRKIAAAEFAITQRLAELWKKRDVKR